MKKEIISTDKAPAAIGPYSQAVQCGGFLFISGQIPLDPETNEITGTEVKAQTEQVFKNLGGVLEAAGAGYDQVVKVTVYMRDLSKFTTMNEVYASYFKEEFPARAAVEVSRLPKDVLVEADAIAFLG